MLFHLCFTGSIQFLDRSQFDRDQRSGRDRIACRRDTGGTNSCAVARIVSGRGAVSGAVLWACVDRVSKIYAGWSLWVDRKNAGETR